MSGGEPTVQNVLYRISMQTLVHPSLCLSCSTAGKKKNTFLYPCELLLLRWSHAPEFITISNFYALLCLCLNKFEHCIQDAIVLARNADTTVAKQRQLCEEDAPLTYFILAESQDVTHQHGATGAGGAQTQGSLLPLFAVRRRRRGLLQGPQVAERSETREPGGQLERSLWQLKQLVWQLKRCSVSENHVINLAQACVSTAER